MRMLFQTVSLENLEEFAEYAEVVLGFVAGQEWGSGRWGRDGIGMVLMGEWMRDRWYVTCLH